MKKYVLLVLLVVAAAIGWYWASPYYTLHSMREAARSGDREALLAYVDFPALRQDVKAEVTARMAAKAGRDQSGIAALSRAIQSALTDPMVDAVITPEGIGAALGVAKAGEGLVGDPRSASLRIARDPVVVRRGLDEFLLAARDDPNSGLVFRRHGLGWRLSGVDLPPQ